MKMYRNLLFGIALAGVSLASCSVDKTSELSGELSSIREKNIADKRLEYFDVRVEKADNNKALTGATVSEAAYAELRELAQNKNLDFQVEMLPTGEFKNEPWGLVTLSVCNIRAGARHSAELVTQAIMGTPVKVYTKEDGWYLVQTPDRYFGWVDAPAIALKTTAELKEWKALEKVLYKNQYGSAYTGPDEKSGVMTDLVLADLLTVTGDEGYFYKILLPDGREGFVKKEDCTSLETWKRKEISMDKVLATAFGFKGVPYLWGGTSAKMVDCSGFTKTVYYLNGILLQRDASQQTLYGELIETNGDYSVLEPCDLVFFGRAATGDKPERVTHVGMCIGDSEFIHASGKVRINSLDKKSEKYTEYYETAFVRARRIKGNVDGKGIEWITDNEFYKEILPQ